MVRRNVAFLDSKCWMGRNLDGWIDGQLWLLRACRTGSPNKCEPFDFLLRGMGKDRLHQIDHQQMEIGDDPKIASKEHGFDSFTASGVFETPTCKAWYFGAALQ